MAALAAARPAPAVRRRGAGAVLRVVFGLIGLALLAAAAFTVWRHVGAVAPYRYVQAAPSATPTQLRTVQLTAAEDGRVLAEADVASAPDGPVLLDWRAKVDDPLLYLTAPRSETEALAAVLARHRAPDTPVLAWWDTSRQLRHFAGASVLFDRHLGIPLFIPARWRAERAQVLEAERAFWGEAGDAPQRAAFETFARALVAPEDEGVKLLRSLVPGRKAVLVLHLRDAVLLGEMFPAALGVSFQDFADSGDVHRSARGVRGWLAKDQQAAYGVIRLPDSRLRAVALRDDASASTLAARLLPFAGNRQDDVRGLTLVYRSGGYVVFELAPAD